MAGVRVSIKPSKSFRWILGTVQALYVTRFPDRNALVIEDTLTPASAWNTQAGKPMMHCLCTSDVVCLMRTTLYMHMHTYGYAYMYIYIHILISVYIYIYTHTYIHTWHTRTCACTS